MTKFRQQHELRPAEPESTNFSRIAHRAFAQLIACYPQWDGPYRFFMFGYSGPVSVFLQYCIHAGKTVEVLTPTMRPLAEGPALKVLDGLTGLGMDRLSVTVVPDAAVPAVLAGEGDDTRKCSLVLMECEALLGTPDDGSEAEKASVANSLGCLAVAQLADANGVPLWILTETAKAYCAPDVSCWALKPKSRVGVLPASAFMHETAASEASRKSTARYPRSEVIPSGYVSAIITEKPYPFSFVRKPEQRVPE